MNIDGSPLPITNNSFSILSLFIDGLPLCNFNWLNMMTGENSGMTWTGDVKLFQISGPSAHLIHKHEEGYQIPESESSFDPACR